MPNSDSIDVGSVSGDTIPDVSGDASFTNRNTFSGNTYLDGMPSRTPARRSGRPVSIEKQAQDPNFALDDSTASIYIMKQCLVTRILGGFDQDGQRQMTNKCNL